MPSLPKKRACTPKKSPVKKPKQIKKSAELAYAALPAEFSLWKSSDRVNTRESEAVTSLRVDDAKHDFKSDPRSTFSREKKSAGRVASYDPLVKDICQAIADKKGFNILVLDVREVSSMTDYFIIAEGNVERHVTALADHVQDVLREKGVKPAHVEGLREGNWVVLDYLDLMVHFFVPELRQYYALEEVWKQGKVITVPVEYETKE